MHKIDTAASAPVHRTRYEPGRKEDTVGGALSDRTRDQAIAFTVLLDRSIGKTFFTKTFNSYYEVKFGVAIKHLRHKR